MTVRLAHNGKPHSPLFIDASVPWARVLRRIVKTGTGCWLFTGAVNSRGYGCVSSGRQGRTILTHRLAVIVRDGGIPAGMVVDHACHDKSQCQLGEGCLHRRCVNPDHLRVISNAENVGRRT